ncbi:hypothetical protein ABZ464_24135 [Streptomyces sp. NPDC005820]|uniref:hypothetical protein n=1 Tax=Streptomyces sp. NPDC005820 TaxID=3157069 RepID=UPI0033C0F129
MSSEPPPGFAEAVSPGFAELVALGRSEGLASSEPSAAPGSQAVDASSAAAAAAAPRTPDFQPRGSCGPCGQQH